MAQLKELLDLFEIKELNEKELKMAKKKVLMLHPDKNKVDTKEHYIHFKNAYEKLLQIYGYIHHELDENNFKSEDIDTTFKNFIESKGFTPSKNHKMYLKHFNDMFDNVHIKEKEDEGYDEWLKSNNDIYDKDDLEKSRKTLMSTNTNIIKIEQIVTSNEINSSYSDLKDAHVNTIIGLDQEKLYREKQKFNSVEEYRRHRTNIGEMLSEKDSLKQIKENELLEKNKAIDLSYQLLKQEEEMKKRTREYVSKFLMLV
jgi:hypothetical protein